MSNAFDDMFVLRITFFDVDANSVGLYRCFDDAFQLALRLVHDENVERVEITYNGEPLYVREENTTYFNFKHGALV